MDGSRQRFDPEVEAQQEVMYRFVDDVLSSIGPRPSCSDQERRLGDLVGDAWERLGFDVRREPFSCHPAAFLDTLRVGVLLYVLAIALYWVSPIIGAALSATFITVAFLETLGYRQLLDPLFRRAEGVNVAGVIRSREPRQRRVLVNAHLDSAFEFTLWYYLKNWASPLMILTAIAGFIPVVGGVIAATGWASPPVVECIGWIGVGALPLVLSLLWFRSNKAVPGAMDDLAGVGVLMGLGGVLARSGPLATTEVVLLATSAEEAGLRGAMHWVDSHSEEYSSLPTSAIVLDGIYDEHYLRVVDRELLAGTRHDSSMVALAQRAAADRGRQMKVCTIPLGATDASAFTRAGVKSTCLLCQDTSRLVPNYHTRNDTLDHVRPVSLTVTLQVVRDMLAALDRDQP